MKDLEIIIPAYNAHKTIVNTLDSIKSQKTVFNYHVTIVNDQGKDYKGIINKYKQCVDIDEIKTPENIGPGGARQYGIDNTQSKYILFIDSDDSLYDEKSLAKLYTKINQTKADLVVSSFIYNKDGITEIKERESIWLHGKIYNRSFLEKNNIKFNNTRSNEDNGFNSLVILMRPTTVIINDITYIYNDNPNSLTRKNNSFANKGLEGYSYNINWAIEEASKRKAHPEDLALKTLEGLITMYKYYNELYKDNDVSQIITWSQELYKKYIEYNQYINNIETDILAKNKPNKEYISFKDYLKEIKNTI